MTRQVTILALFAAGCVGPVVTEPMPDIPETVEYETVRIEYGEDDDLVDRRQGLSPNALVGDPSLVAHLSKTVVRGTNELIRGQLALIDAIVANPPSEVTEQSWVWDNGAFIDEGDERSRFTIEEVEDGVYEYHWSVGPGEDELLEIFSGQFSPRVRGDEGQRGSGVLRFDFDSIRRLRPMEDGPVGLAVVAFRAVGGVRQVRIATLDFGEPGEERRNRLSEYVQLADGTGRFAFSSRVDFLKDGQPEELMTVDAVWNSSREGRSMVRMSGGTLMTNEVLLEECWDAADDVAFADLTPDLPGLDYEDGTVEGCAEGLLDYELQPGDASPPGTEPEIPDPHPDEED